MGSDIALLLLLSNYLLKNIQYLCQFVKFGLKNSKSSDRLPPVGACLIRLQRDGHCTDYDFGLMTVCLCTSAVHFAGYSRLAGL